MKIRVERCEVISVVRIQGDISNRDLQVLAAGLPRLATGVKILLVSFQGSSHNEAMLPALLPLKAKLGGMEGLQFGIISHIEEFADFDSIETAMAQIPGPLGKLMAEKFGLENIKEELSGKIATFEKKLKTYEDQKLTVEKLVAEKSALETENELLLQASRGLISRLKAQQEPVFSDEEKKKLPTLKDNEKALKELLAALAQKGFVP